MTTMLSRLNGRQLAGWGYGIFWTGLLFETINAIISAHSTFAFSSPVFWVGQIFTFGCVGLGITMLSQIRHRPW